MLKKWLLGLGVAGALILGAHRASATLSSTTLKTICATGNGATQNYTIGFTFQDNTQLLVNLVDTSTTPSTISTITQGAGAGKYTVTGGNPGTTVVMGTAPSSVQHCVIQRVVTLTQTTAYDPNSAFPASDHEAQMDKAMMAIQQINANQQASVTLSPASSASPTPTIPDPLANNFLIYDSTPKNFTLFPAGVPATNTFPMWNGSAWVSEPFTSAQLFTLLNASGGPLASSAGGTGIANSNTLTWAGGNLTFTLSGATNVTLPSGSSTLLTSPMTTLGDTMYGGASGAVSRLAGDTTNADVFFSQKSTAGVAAAPTWKASTGTGSVVLATSPTLVSPALGTPTALVGTNISGTAASLTAGNVTTNANLTGDVTSVGNATTIAANAVTNAKAAQMAQHTFKGNNTAGTANSLDLTATQLTAELNAVVGDSGSGGTKGLVPAPGSGDAAAGKFLKADGTFAVPPGSGTLNGPGSSVDSEVALWNGTGGLTLKRATGTGVAHLTSGVLSAATTTIAEGGTGQTTKAAAFDALAPTSTKGDLPVYSTTNTRQGSPGDYGRLLPDQTTPTGWRSASYTQFQNGAPTKNYVQYADLENNSTTGWTASGCATVTSGYPNCPGSGGTAFTSSNGGRAKNANTASPAIDSGSNVSGTYSLNLATTGAGAIGDGYVSSLYTLDPSDRGATFSYRIAYKQASGAPVTQGTANDTYAVSFYDAANNTFLTPSNPFCFTNTSKGFCTGYVNTSTTTTGLQAFVYSPIAPVGASSLLLDDFYLGTQALPTGPPETDWVACTPTTNNVTVGNGTLVGQCRRVGANMEMMVYFSFGSTSSFAGTIEFGPPSPYTIAPAAATSGMAVGSAFAYHAAGTQHSGAVYVLNSSFAVIVGQPAGYWNATNPFTFASAVPDQLSLHASIPITGWSSNVTMLSSTSNTPTVQTFAGNTSGTYTAPAGVKWIEVIAVAGGAGGSGSSTVAGNNGGTGGTGGNTTFGTSLITATGPAGGAFAGNGPVGGGFTINAPATDWGDSVTGGAGGGGGNSNAGVGPGSQGGVNLMGGTCSGAATGGTAGAGVDGTGAGGCGGMGSSTVEPGVGGGAGGYAHAIINNPSATYAYTVGNGGLAGTLGTSGAAGGAGGKGKLVIREYYTPNPNVAVDSPYVSMGTEGAGTTTLTNASQRDIITTLSAARTYTLPSGGIKAGDSFRITNTADFALTLQSSGANTIAILNVGTVAVKANVNNPSAKADWEVVQIKSKTTLATTFQYVGGSGGSASGSINVQIERNGDTVTVYNPGAVSTSGTSNTHYDNQTAIPVGYRPAAQLAVFAITRNNGAGSTGLALINSSGTMALYRDYAATAYSTTTSCGYQEEAHWTYYAAL